jgi:type IV secretory pathway VirB10-like protein
VSDPFDDADLDDEHLEVEDGAAVHDPGGVPRLLTLPGYRSMHPLVGYGAGAIVFLVIVTVLWSLLVHPWPSMAANAPIVVSRSQIESTPAPQVVIPDPTDAPLGTPRTHPVISIVHPTATPRGVAVSTSSSMTYQSTQVPRARTSDEIAADENAREIAAAAHGNSRMQLETQDAQAQRDLATSGAVASGTSAGNYPVQGAPQTEFASDTGGNAVPHSAFIAQHSGDPGYQAATSRYELVAGTIIPARLVTAIDSTVPGGIIKAEVVESIFDSETHSVVVVPRGTIAIGSADSAQYGEARLVASWTELYLPNGRKFFASSNEGAGTKGEAGMPVSVDTHAGRAFGNALVGAVLQAGVNLASRASTIVDVNSAATSVQAPTRPSPTLHAYPGQLFNIVLNHDLPLDRYEPAQR